MTTTTRFLEDTTAAGPSVLHRANFPAFFTDVEHLEDFMSMPTQELVDDLAHVPGDITVLGAAGKMGVTLARVLKRAAPEKRIIAVSRFTDAESRAKLEKHGIETISCDLLDRDAVGKLPHVENVIYMAGLKFDFTGREDFLWAMNTLAPAIVADAFARSRIVSLSTIHVYPWSDPLRGGVTESTPPLARPGEYANSVVGRERIFEYFSRLHGSPGRNVRFVYAIDMRYGVLQEIASWVLEGKTIPLETGTVSIMWQGDAINQFARLLRYTEIPASPLNVGGPEMVSVRKVAEQFGALFGIEPVFSGAEGEALAVNCDQAAALLGNPYVTVDTMVKWVAEWAQSGKPTLGKPSKFEVRSGRF
ncbi:NAD(P)-dependent oxidoreductase (plasmid) [Glaciihabitans sp. INWT7]|uniref:NAD-dependent epimerase/dehydratase family protein n=1 Tax=Glaciihabitans sp. INWT7 TaxID=2596912 RepID=UPI001626E939|nr:NAD(P)-dependent oxidoreductase [Glaciihabitans sp. INWT7]QNE48641.1 NAD(P)-dependent oxidoreductase [Glaciihabitans sp. INWT7]